MNLTNNIRTILKLRWNTKNLIFIFYIKFTESDKKATENIM
jgi:hypothetical protein